METNHLSSEKLEAIKDTIFAIDFTHIINKMVSHQKWRRHEAEKACELYRNFLYLNVKYPDEAPLPPSEDIDEFWHNHVLDTKKYIADCDAIFGKYFHHYPYLGIDGKTTLEETEKYFQKTQALHHKEFGEYIEKVRRNFIASWLLHWASTPSKNETKSEGA